MASRGDLDEPTCVELPPQRPLRDEVGVWKLLRHREAAALAKDSVEFSNGARSIRDLPEDADQEDVVQAVRSKWEVDRVGLDEECLARARYEAPSGLDKHFALDVETYKEAPWTDLMCSF